MNSISKVLRSGIHQVAQMHSAMPTPPVDAVRAIQQRAKPLSLSAYDRSSSLLPYRNQTNTGSFTSSGSVLQERKILEVEDSHSTKSETTQRDEQTSSAKREMTPAERQIQAEIREYQDNKRAVQMRTIVNMKALALISQSSIDITNPSKGYDTSLSKHDNSILEGIDTNSRVAVSRAYQMSGTRLIWG